MESNTLNRLTDTKSNKHYVPNKKDNLEILLDNPIMQTSIKARWLLTSIRLCILSENRHITSLRNPNIINHNLYQ